MEHYETRTSVLEGKAMVVAMSRDNCVSLFDEIIKLRPEWAGTKLTKDGKDIGWNHEDGAIRIVMTGTASDRPGLQDHVYCKGQKKRLAKRFKDAKDPLKLVIVREGEAPRRLWLTGFDAPCCHTMYVDKPMAGLQGAADSDPPKPMRCHCREETAFHWLTMGFGDSEIAAP